MVTRLQLAPEVPDLNVVGSTYGEVGIWGIRLTNQSATLPDLGLRKGRFSSDGRYFLGATSGGDIEIRESETGTHLATIASS